MAQEKEKSSRFGSQKAEEANKYPSPPLRVSGQGDINMAVRDACLQTTLRSTSGVSCLPLPAGI